MSIPKFGYTSQLIQLGKDIIEKGFTWGTSGNLSILTSPGKMLITASGTFIGSLAEDDLVEYDFKYPEKTTKKASKEAPIHVAAYEARPDINVIIHASPFYTTMASCTDLVIRNRIFVENMYYLERIEYVDYFHPGSPELADAVGKASKASDIIIMRNHGVLVLDKSVADAFIALETLENSCRMQIEAMAAGLSFNEVSKEKCKDFLENSRYKKRKVWIYDEP